MEIDIITLFPEMFTPLNYGVTHRALQNKLINLNYWNPRQFTHNKHQTVDDRPYGGGPGMVMMYQPIADAIAAAQQRQQTPAKVIYFSPQGKPLTQETLSTLTQETNLILLCGRYEGIDERLIDDHVDIEYSIGDYVVSGGELPCLVFLDALARLLPGVLGHSQSAEQDSFSHGLLDHPQYTRPETINGQKVPNILLSGDHNAIKTWRLQQSLGKTWQKRPDLLKRRPENQQEQKLLEDYINNLTLSHEDNQHE